MLLLRREVHSEPLLREPQLFMIEDSAVTDSPLEEGFGKEIEPKIVFEIPFHTIARSSHPQTLYVMEKLKNREVVILIDGGSTHNCIDETLTTKYGLSINKSKKIQVMVSNKGKIECVGLCHNLTITIQRASITTNYYVLLVAACPLVLEVQWFATSRPVNMDYLALTMSFNQ